MRRRDLLALVTGVTTLRPLAVRAQQKKMPVIGFLHSGSPGPAGPFVAAFRQSLSANGYAEGQNVLIEYRWAEGQFDRLPALAAELVARRVDVIVAGGGRPSTIAAKGATAAIPIVFANVGNPVEQGLAASLARPGGNLTGVSILLEELTQKRIELLTELVPQAKVIGLLVNPKNPANETTVGDPRQAARAKGVQIEILEASSDTDINAAFAALHGLHGEALLVSPDPLFFINQDRMVALAAQYAVPVMYGWREFVVAGGLISYAPSIIRTYSQTAIYVAKILKGANQAELPIEQPTKFELMINLKTAKTLGLTVPQALLARADEVIE
jgi:putative tryptophan/tyrosine transport system substrate-binding protein